MSNPSHSSAAIERRPAPRAPGPPGGYFFGRLLERWDGGNASAPFDLHHEMMRVTLRIVTRTLFSTDSDADADSVRAAMTVAIGHANEYAESIVRIPPWVPLPKNVRFRRAMRT